METLRQRSLDQSAPRGLFSYACNMVAVFALVLFCLGATGASAETRSLKLYFLHTGEKAEITFKKNGKYVQSGLRKINRFLRDWRRNEPTKMDPRLLDLIWETYKETGSRKHIHVISGYRSPATNSLLRKRGRGVAKKSQHTLGKALDFFIPGVSLRKLRNIALRKGLGGVGYYPKSGSPFVHMDTGRVRHWPRMSRSELVKVFPKGDTLHVPTDGKPLARYNQAKAAYERKVKGQGKIVIAKAEEIEKKPGLFAKLLGRGEEEEGQLGSVAAPKPVTVKAAPAPAAKVPEPSKPEPAAPEPATPEPALTATPEIILASLPLNAVPIPVSSPRTIALAASQETTTEPEADAGAETETAIAEVTAEEPENNVDAPVELAYGIPLPSQRPDLEPAVEIGEVTNPEPAKEPVRIAALTPVEIEDLRRQVYSSLSPQPGEPVVRAPLPSEPIANVTEIANAAQSDTSNRLSLLPEPNPRKNSSFEIARRMATLAPLEPGSIATQTTAVPLSRPVIESANLAPIEPGTAATEEPAVPQTRPVIETASLTPLEPGSVSSERPGIPQAKPVLETASLEPLEPGTRSSNETPLPAPNPERPSAVVEDEVQLAEGIPVPRQADRQALTVASLSREESSQAAPAPSRAAGQLDRLAPNAAAMRKLGIYALAADTSIASIGDIRPPAYAKNIIRERPTMVLSQGFVTNANNLLTSGFNGSSVEFLDFTRF